MILKGHAHPKMANVHVVTLMPAFLGIILVNPHTNPRGALRIIIRRSMSRFFHRTCICTRLRARLPNSGTELEDDRLHAKSNITTRGNALRAIGTGHQLLVRTTARMLRRSRNRLL